MKNSSFIRDLLVKVLLIVIFIFLLMYLFPMPNLKPFYSSIFNNNIQTMKDAAEDYYTTERMPSENGKSTKMTLQEMIDEKLIIPFVDKDNKSCDTKKSYVEVTKKDNEYELKVNLKCGKESYYIIEKIGCYNFCPSGSCTLAEIKENEEAAKVPVTTKTDKDGNVRVVTPTNGRYIYEYEYKKKFSNESWKTGDWTNTKQKETNDVKLVDKRTQYTGQKKVSSGTTIREQVAYDTKTDYTYDDKWTTDTTCQGNCALWKERTLYTGQKKVTTKTTKYVHDKYATKDNWTYDENWTTDVKKETDNLKLWKERTLYTGQKKVSSGTTIYVHDRYGNKDNWTYDNDWTTNTTCNPKQSPSDGSYGTPTCQKWKERTLYTGQKKVTTTEKKYLHVKYGERYEWNETGWTTIKKNDTDDIKLVDTRYTVRKTTNTTTTSCNNYTLDSTWYSSKPANTSSKVYSSTPTNTRYGECGDVIDTIKSTEDNLKAKQGNLCYELIPNKTEVCTSNCSNSNVYYYYRVRRRNSEYQYSYCVPKTTVTPYTDTQVVKDPTSYVNDGYTIVKTEYNYKVRKTIKYVVDSVETNSITPPAGYEYANQSTTYTKNSYVSLGKWVTTQEGLGEYTYNVKTAKQYKYAYNNPKRYYIDSVETTTKESPAGYVYSYSYSKNKTSYVSLGKWVTTQEGLGEYTYNVVTAKQYKYAYNDPKTYYVNSVETDSKVSPEGYIYSYSYTKTKTTYESFGKWATSINGLGDYTYNIKTAKQYKYKYKHTEPYEKDRNWTTNTVPDKGYEFTGNVKTTTKDTYLDLGRWVNSKKDLGEYTYNIKTRTQYRYKYRSTNSWTETIWARSNPGNGFEPTGNSRKVWIQDRVNKQK